MYELLLALIVVLFAVLKTRERFQLRTELGALIPVKKNPGDIFPTSWDNGRTLIMTGGSETKGTQIIATWPDSCPIGQDYDAGLCYEKCRDDYTGIGPVCYKNTTNTGIGVPVGLEPCPAGWTNDGLTCREPIKCEPVTCAKGLDFFKKGCSGGTCSGGRVKGRMNQGGICDWPSDRGNLPDHLVDKSDPKNYKATHPEKVDGLCYKACPKNRPKRVPGMPYLCTKDDGPMTYGRGLGKIPCTVRSGDACIFAIMGPGE